jgi:8-oxo-dGTP diphosphatase
MSNSYQSHVKNKLVTFRHQGNLKLPSFKDVTSVAAIPFTSKGSLVVVDLYHRGLDLPGGHVEPGETSPEQTLKREVMEEASMTIKSPVLVEVIESDYFDDHSSYMLIYGVFVDELLDFVPNDESRDRIIVSKEDFIDRYEAGGKVLMKKAVDDAWVLLNESSKLVP